MATQLGIPVVVPPDEVVRKRSLGAAMELCAELGGFEMDKQLEQRLNVDKGQFSRWLSESEGVKWAKLSALMDACGNDAPVLWMLHQRGYDLHSLRLRETETERALREKDEELRKTKERLEYLESLHKGR